MKLLIIADDFTGALDTGVQLSKFNIPTTVFADIDNTAPEGFKKIPENCEVLVINADIRHKEPKDAYQISCELLQFYAKPGTKVYLKTDSALRGNISALFQAAINTLNESLYFVPAFPDLKRTTRNATAYIDGVLLEKSVFRNDPRTPTLESYIPHILCNPYPLSYNCVPIDNIDSSINNRKKDNQIYLFDCETNEQMDYIGNKLADSNLYGLTAGCAGFASTFAKHITFETKDMKNDVINGPALFISGSANAVTLAQLNYAKQHNYPVLALSESIFALFNDSTSTPKDKAFYKDLRFQTMLKQAVSELSSKQSVILATATETTELFDLEKIKKVLNRKESIHNYIAEYTSCLVKSILDSVSISNIVVFGGDMVAAILEKLDCHQVDARGEITPGVPICSISLKDKTYTLVTKSGGFGSEDMIPVIEQYLNKH